jgi:triacylglycerol lipase
MRKLVAAVGAALLASGAMAQVPPDIAAKVRETGQTMDPSAGELYAPMFAAKEWGDISITRDVPYGDDPLHVLDLYVPGGAADARRPVVLFVHGGGFTRGDKHGPFYPDNMTAWAASQGMVAVSINYRLAPADPWPAAAQDLASAIAWTRANIARYGGDPDRIILWGHSAGGNHVADYIGHNAVQGPEAAAIKGAILLSPFYADDVSGEPAHAYYGADADLQTASAAIERLRASGVPLFIGYAQFDPEPMRHFAEAAIAQLCESGYDTCPASVDLPDHNHFTEGMAVGTDDVSLSGPVMQWIEALE